MKKPVKIGLGIVAAIALLLVAGVVFVALRIDSIVESTVEKEGTSQLKLATTLDGADVSLLGGSLTLDGLEIANPEGYSAANLFQMGQVNVRVGYSDLTGEPVKIEQININSPALVIERNPGPGGIAEQLRVNLQAMLENLDLESETEPTKLLINQLNVAGTRVAVRPNVDGLDEEYAITLPDIQMNDIGNADGAQNGAEFGRVTADVVMTLARKAAESQDLPPEVRAILAGDLSGLLAQYGDKLGAEVKQQLVKELGDQLGGELGDAAGRAIDQAAQGDLEGAARDATTQAIEQGRNRLEDEARRGFGRLLGGDDDE